MITPTCRKCGKQHYNIQSCEARDDGTRERVKTKPFLENTWKAKQTWGDKLSTLSRIGRNTTSFGSLRTAPMRTGSISHPTWTPPPERKL